MMIYSVMHSATAHIMPQIFILLNLFPQITLREEIVLFQYDMIEKPMTIKGIYNIDDILIIQLLCFRVCEVVAILTLLKLIV